MNGEEFLGCRATVQRRETWTGAGQSAPAPSWGELICSFAAVAVDAERNSADSCPPSIPSNSQLSTSRSGSSGSRQGSLQSGSQFRLRGSRSYLGSRTSLASLSRRNLASESSRFQKPSAQVLPRHCCLPKMAALCEGEGADHMLVAVSSIYCRCMTSMERMSPHCPCCTLISPSQSVQPSHERERDLQSLVPFSHLPCAGRQAITCSGTRRLQ